MTKFKKSHQDGEKRRFWSSRNMRVDLLEWAGRIARERKTSVEDIVNIGLEIGLRIIGKGERNK